MSREHEINCLNKVKSALNGESSIKIDACNCDIKNIKDIFNSAIPNPNNSIFPDFIFPNGSLEHFGVTSSKENRKGSSFKIAENESTKKIEDFFEQQTNAFYEKEHIPNSVSSATATSAYTDFSYRCFLNSVKKNVEKHLESLAKTLNAGDAVFLIEQQDARLGIYKDNIFNKFYLISEDKELLLYFKQYCDILKYIVFISVDSVEIIYLPNIDSFIRFSKASQDIRGGRFVSVSAKLMFDLY